MSVLHTRILSHEGYDSSTRDEIVLPTVTPDPSYSPEPTQEVYMEEMEDRSVYDSDISDSILAKLSAYYNEYGKDQTYAIYRSDQYHYYLVYGVYNNGRFSDAVQASYVVSSAYNGSTTFSVSSGSYSPDLTGSTGYIYSNISTAYIPSRYIDSQERYSLKMTSIMTVILILGLLLSVLLVWTRRLRKR